MNVNILYHFFFFPSDVREDHDSSKILFLPALFGSTYGNVVSYPISGCLSAQKTVGFDGMGWGFKDY